MADVYRISLVWMFYTTKVGGKTPTPFAELRVFFFTDRKPTLDELRIARAGMREILDALFEIFTSLAMAIDMKAVNYDEDMPVTSISAKIKTEIEGFEVEEIDFDEVMEYFKTEKRRFKFFENFRYARFYKPDGSIKREYDEFDIRRYETVPILREKREVGAEITKMIDEIWVFMRQLETSRKEYERMIERLRRL